MYVPCETFACIDRMIILTGLSDSNTVIVVPERTKTNQWDISYMNWVSAHPYMYVFRDRLEN